MNLVLEPLRKTCSFSANGMSVITYLRGVRIKLQSICKVSDTGRLLTIRNIASHITKTVMVQRKINYFHSILLHSSIAYLSSETS